MRSKFKPLIVLLILVLTLGGCGTSNNVEGTSTDQNNKEAKSDSPRVIKVSTKFVDDEQTAISLKKAVDRINERCEGALELQVFTGGVLPIGKDGMEQVASGSDWMLVDGVDFLGDYIPDYNAIIGPMLYQTFDEYLKMVRTPLVQNLNEQAEEKGIKVLSLDWVFGFRSFMLNKVAKTPEDMKGLNVRVPTSKLYTLTIKAMGANPVAMPYPDTYAALQQGVIDGVEGSIMTYYGTKQYENVKEYCLTRHLLGVSAVTISKQCWDSLTEEQRNIIQEEINNGAEDNLKETLRLEGEYAEKLKELGVNFHEVDVEAFRKAVAPVYSMFPEWTPGIYDKITAELEKIREELKK